jgi:hypothetical protein
MVRRVTFNPLLKGERQRNNKVAIRVNETGRRKSVAAPVEDRLARQCPHLAFIDPARYDRLLRLLRGRNDKYSRGRKAGLDRRQGVPRKRTAWPGQHACCGVCGRLYYWGGHGQQEHLMCSGCRDYRCWNAATFDGMRGAALLAQAILAEVEALPDFDEAFVRLVRAKVEAEQSGRGRELARLSDELRAVRQRIERVTEAIAQVGGSRALTEKLVGLEAEEDRLLRQRDLLGEASGPPLTLPPAEEIKRLAREAVGGLAVGSPEFGRLMRRLVPSLTVHPYRLCDGGPVVLRAKLTLNLVPLLTPASGVGELGGVLRRELAVDLFEPPQRVLFRGRVVALRAQGRSAKEVAAGLGITGTAAQRAAALQRLMDERGLADPYVPVPEPPAGATRLQRHLNRRYRFEPLDGFPAQ